jgi:hypothetical protein
VLRTVFLCRELVLDDGFSRLSRPELVTKINEASLSSPR